MPLYMYTVPETSVVALSGLLGELLADTSPYMDTATTLNVYSVPGSSPVTFVLGSLPSTVTFLITPPPLTKIVCLESSGKPLPVILCCHENEIHDEPNTASACKSSGAAGGTVGGREGGRGEEGRREGGREGGRKRGREGGREGVQ